MFSDDMKAVATDLISDFGSQGAILIPSSKPDPITGLGGGSDKYAVLYYREYFTGRELSGSMGGGQIVADRIESGDALISVVFDQVIENDWSFEDDENVSWNILSVQPIETQGKDVMYQVHIRR